MRVFTSGMGVARGDSHWGYTSPVNEARRGGGSPHLEGPAALHCSRHTGKSPLQAVGPDAASLYPKTPGHAVTHPRVAGDSEHALQLQLSDSCGGLSGGGGPRGAEARRSCLLPREAGPEGGTTVTSDRKPRPQHGRAQRSRLMLFHRYPVTLALAPPICSHSLARSPSSRGTRDPPGASHVRLRSRVGGGWHRGSGVSVKEEDGGMQGVLVLLLQVVLLLR